MPSAERASLQPELFSQAHAKTAIGRAKQLRLDQRGAPLAIVRRADGQLTVEARVMRGAGLNAYMEVYTLETPQGERREIGVPPVPPSKRVSIPDDIIN